MVVAMAEKETRGQLVAANKRYVLRRSSVEGQQLSHMLYIGRQEMEAKTEYIIQIRADDDEDVITEYKQKSDKSGDQVNLPRGQVQSHERLRPGETVNIYVYEYLKPVQDILSEVNEDSESDKTTDEKIDEIHNMISEMYGAYISTKDD